MGILLTMLHIDRTVVKTITVTLLIVNTRVALHEYPYCFLKNCVYTRLPNAYTTYKNTPTGRTMGENNKTKISTGIHSASKPELFAKNDVLVSSARRI